MRPACKQPGIICISTSFPPASHRLSYSSPLDGLVKPSRSPAVCKLSSLPSHTISTQSQYPSDSPKVDAPQVSHHCDSQGQPAGGCSRQLCHLQHQLHNQHFLLLFDRLWDAAVVGWSASPCAVPQHQQRPSIHHCILTTSPTSTRDHFFPMIVLSTTARYRR